MSSDNKENAAIATLDPKGWMGCLINTRKACQDHKRNRYSGNCLALVY